MMAVKNVLWKCSFRSIKENKGRTFVTVLGVALATGLITAMICLLGSLLASYVEYVKKTNGDAHATFQGVAPENLKYFVNNKSVDEAWIARREGYVCLGKLRYGNVTDYLEVLAVSPDWFTHRDGGVQLSSGRFPETEDEIVVDKKLRTELGLDVKIGDEITLAVGRRYLDGQEIMLGMPYRDGEEIHPDFEKTYVVVGLTDGQDDFSASGLSMMGRNRQSGNTYAYAYRAFTYLDAEALIQDMQDEVAGENGEVIWDGQADQDTLYDVSLRYTKKGLRQYKEVNAALLGITPELYERVFVTDYDKPKNVAEEERVEASKVAKGLIVADGWNDLIRLESYDLINQATYVFVTVIEIVFLVILLAGVFCINNSFDLTFTERVRFYGMMSSIGTTKRQRRALVLCEGAVIGAYGIPLGIFLGVSFAFGIVQFTNLMLRVIEKNAAFTMIFRVHVLPIMIAAVLSAFMIWMSASESAARAAKVMPMEAIRLNDVITAGQGGKRKTAGKWPFGAVGNLAVKNYKRAKLKYRGSITSIALSAALIIGMSFARQIYVEMESRIWAGTNCQLQVGASGSDWWETFQKLKQFAKNDDGISTTEIMTMLWFQQEEGLQDKMNSSSCYVKILNREAFEALCAKAGVDPLAAKGKGIVNCTKVKKGPAGLNEATGESLAKFNPGDALQGEHKYNYVRNEDGKWDYDSTWVEVEIACQADDVFPISEPHPIGAILIYVSEDWVEKYPQIKSLSDLTVSGYFLGDDVNSFEDKLREANFGDLFIVNYDRQYKRLKYTGILIVTLLGSFLGIITMIGITNVINAIGTNLELRAPEFARLRAIGTTRKELRKMVRLEAVIFGGKGLIYGLLIGTGISYGLYRFLWESGEKKWEFHYHVPALEIVICTAVVGGLLMMIVERGIRRLEKRNVVETIRDENL